MERGKWNARQLLGKDSLQQRVKMLPETAAGRHHVLPEPRLALMNPSRDTLSERRAVEHSADTLLVHGVAGLVQRREQRVAKVVLADAGGDANVASGEFETLHTWLCDNVYRHGSKFVPNDLVKRATGEAINTGPYLDYLREKYGALYRLSANTLGNGRSFAAPRRV